MLWNCPVKAIFVPVHNWAVLHWSTNSSHSNRLKERVVIAGQVSAEDIPPFIFSWDLGEKALLRLLSENLFNNLRIFPEMCFDMLLRYLFTHHDVNQRILHKYICWFTWQLKTTYGHWPLIFWALPDMLFLACVPLLTSPRVWCLDFQIPYNKVCVLQLVGSLNDQVTGNH